MPGINSMLDEYILLLETENENLRKQVSYWKTRKMPNYGIVYVLQQENTSNYKIGISTSYKNRIKQFGVTLPFNVIEIATYETELMKESEKAIHEFFREKRLNGSEFFELEESDLEEIPKIIDKVKSQSQIVPQKDVEVERVKKDTFREDEMLLIKAKEFKDNGFEISSSFLQRKLKLGYARAARIKDMLNESPIE